MDIAENHLSSVTNEEDEVLQVLLLKGIKKKIYIILCIIYKTIYCIYHMNIINTYIFIIYPVIYVTLLIVLHIILENLIYCSVK